MDKLEACTVGRAQRINHATVSVTGASSSFSKEIILERAAGIEPASLAWKAKVLPLHNARSSLPYLFQRKFEVNGSAEEIWQETISMNGIGPVLAN